MLEVKDRVRITGGGFIGQLGIVHKIEKRGPHVQYVYVDTDLGVDDVKVDPWNIAIEPGEKS